MVERSEVIRLSTKASLELVEVGRNGEATSRATQSLERGVGEVQREREGVELVRFDRTVMPLLTSLV
jgi:hypothetical protein